MSGIAIISHDMDNPGGSFSVAALGRARAGESQGGVLGTVKSPGRPRCTAGVTLTGRRPPGTVASSLTPREAALHSFGSALLTPPQTWSHHDVMRKRLAADRIGGRPRIAVIQRGGRPSQPGAGSTAHMKQGQQSATLRRASSSYAGCHCAVDISRGPECSIPTPGQRR